MIVGLDYLANEDSRAFLLWFQENGAESIASESPANTTVDKSVTITSVPTTVQQQQQAASPHGQAEEEEEEQHVDKKALESDSGFVVDQQTINNQSPSSSSSSSSSSRESNQSGIHLEVAESVHIQSQSHSPGSMSDLELIIPTANKKPSEMSTTTATSECLGDDTSSFT